jgi:hypothetical protein
MIVPSAPLHDETGERHVGVNDLVEPVAGPIIVLVSLGRSNVRPLRVAECGHAGAGFGAFFLDGLGGVAGAGESYAFADIAHRPADIRVAPLRPCAGWALLPRLYEKPADVKPFRVGLCDRCECLVDRVGEFVEPSHARPRDSASIWRVAASNHSACNS